MFIYSVPPSQKTRFFFTTESFDQRFVPYMEIATPNSASL